MPPEEADRLCPNCGAENFPTSPVCYACGQPTPKHGRHLAPSPYLALDWESSSGFPASLGLTSSSLALVRKHPSLLLYPLAGVGASAAMVLGGLWAIWAGFSVTPPSILPWIGAFAAYLGVFFVVTLAQAGLIHETVRHLRTGANGTVGAASGHGWTVAALAGLSAWEATFGVALALLRQWTWNPLWGTGPWGLNPRLGLTHATYYVIPAILFEGWGPLEALDRSGRLAAATFGDRVVLNATAVVIASVGMIGATAIGVVWFIQATEHGLTAYTMALGAFGLLLGAATAVVAFTLDGVAKADMYLHATTGNVSVVTPMPPLPTG